LLGSARPGFACGFDFIPVQTCENGGKRFALRRIVAAVYAAVAAFNLSPQVYKTRKYRSGSRYFRIIH